MVNSEKATGSQAKEVLDRLIKIYKRKAPPEVNHFIDMIERANLVLLNEEEETRPRDASGLPGGLVYLKKDIPAVIVPDLHARMNFLLSVLLYSFEKGECSLASGIVSGLESRAIQVVCVGDAFHAEGRARRRWELAFEEYKCGFINHEAMDEEMRESLGIMEMIMELKISYPEHFHFLKGNHENIKNELGGGNFPFRKLVIEGEMVAEYVKKFYGEKFLECYYSFEKNLPLLAVGANFLVSHAEPAEFYSREDVIEYRKKPYVVEGLTWTANDTADEGSVGRMIESYLGAHRHDFFYYFGGHRPVKNRYNLRAGGYYVQIHNPEKFIIAVLTPGVRFDLQNDIIEIEDCAHNIQPGIDR